MCFVFRMFFQKGDDGCQNLRDCVFKLLLIRIALRYKIENFIYILFHVGHGISSFCLLDDYSANVTEYSTGNGSLYRHYGNEYNMHQKYKKRSPHILQRPLCIL